VGGQAQDPGKLNIAPQAPLTAAELSRFRSVSGDMMHRFALLAAGGRRQQRHAKRSRQIKKRRLVGRRFSSSLTMKTMIANAAVVDC
jgi:hypothetical protein